MSRSSWKPLFLDSFLLQNLSKGKTLKKVWSRSSAIPSYLDGKRVSVYNGKTFKVLQVTREHVGFKFGEFIFTRKYSLKSTKKK